MEHVPFATYFNMLTNLSLAVEFYVPRYMGGPAAIVMIPEMKSLKVIQSPNAGLDDVLSR